MTVPKWGDRFWLVANASGLNASEKSVLQVLAALTDDSGFARPGMARIATAAGLSTPAAAWRVIQRLIKGKRILQCKGSPGGAMRTNLYRIDWRRLRAPNHCAEKHSEPLRNPPKTTAQPAENHCARQDNTSYTQKTHHHQHPSGQPTASGDGGGGASAADRQDKTAEGRRLLEGAGVRDPRTVARLARDHSLVEIRWAIAEGAKAPDPHNRPGRSVLLLNDGTAFEAVEKITARCRWAQARRAEECRKAEAAEQLRAIEVLEETALVAWLESPAGQAAAPALIVEYRQTAAGRARWLLPDAELLERPDFLAFARKARNGSTASTTDHPAPCPNGQHGGSDRLGTVAGPPERPGRADEVVESEEACCQAATNGVY